MLIASNSCMSAVCVRVQDKLSAELDRLNLNPDIFLMQDQDQQFQMRPPYVMCLFLVIVDVCRQVCRHHVITCLHALRGVHALPRMPFVLTPNYISHLT